MKGKSIQIVYYLSLLFYSLWLFTAADQIIAREKEISVGADACPPEIELITAPFKMVALKRPRFPERVFNIVAYGAIGDSTKKNTEVFRKAIEACSAAGGGTVLVPPGKWLTGAIHLKSNVNLHLQKGAEIHFSDDPKDYLPVVFTRWAGTELYNYSPLIYANGCENIAITGRGKLFGHGERWWTWIERGNKTIQSIYQNQVLKNIPPEKRIAGDPASRLRPQFINPVNCKNVLFEGFTVASPGPFWTFDIVYCKNVIVRGLKLETRGGPNTDGINLDSSEDGLVEYCTFHTGDDGIALKSGINEDGWRVGRPTQNIVVRNNKIFYSLGAVVIGSDMSGNVRNIYVHDCLVDSSSIGLRIKSNPSRGGMVENVYYNHIRMDNILNEAIRVEQNYGAFMASQTGCTFPLFRNFFFKDITCGYAKQAITIQGSKQKPVENIVLENIDVYSEKKMKIDWVSGLSIDDVRYHHKDSPFILPNVLFTKTNRPGLEGEYFNNRFLQGQPEATRIDETIDFWWWAGSSPIDGLEDDDFSIRWTGLLRVPESGLYRIGLQADDGFRLYLDGRLLIDAWGGNNLCSYRGTEIQLEKGKDYDLKIEYFEHVGFGCSFFRFHRVEAICETPEVYYKTDVEKIIRIKKPKDVLERRRRLIRYIFGTEGLPYKKMPDKIEPNYRDERYDDIESLRSIVRLVATMDYGLDSKIYHFIPKHPNHRVILYHQGHRGDFVYGKNVIRKLLDKGYSVLAFSMPLTGMNSMPYVDLPDLGLLRLTWHDQMKFLRPGSGHPVKYFIEPVVVGINYLKRNFRYRDITMIGISGGGWTTTLAAAVDFRIDNSFPVAGSYPVFLRSESARDWGDWEQTIPELLEQANFLEMYILGAYGKGRKQLQIINKYDPCCFAGFKWKAYKDKVMARLQSLGQGEWNLLLDSNNREHKISDFALDRILDEIESK